MKHSTLAAFSIERRIAAVAVFHSTRLEDIQQRHILPDINKASGSVRELVTRTIEHQTPDFVAVSCPSAKAGSRIRALCDVINEVATAFGIPVMEIDESTLRLAYGYPPLVRKEHVRDAGRSIWPSLKDVKSKRAVVDAVTVGLYVQTERLFSLYEEGT